MAVYKIFPLQDATLYSGYPVMNTGIDAILELSSTYPFTVANPIVARPLIQFDQSQINSVIDTLNTGSTAISASLKAFISDANGVVMKSEIYAYPSSGSWNNGSGEYLDNPSTVNGVGWKYRSNSGSNPWLTDNFEENTTGSFITASPGGGNWYTASSDIRLNLEYSQSFNLRTEKDINMDITDIVKTWYSSSKSIPGTYTEIENNGLILKWSDEIEFDTNLSIQPKMQFYSVDTNTIYPPQLEIKWRDYVYNKGTLQVINTPDIYAAIDNNQGVFYSGSINIFRINARPEFPTRTFQTSSIYTTNFALTTSSYYAIKDLDTNEFIIDFDEEFTQISCDPTGSFFTLYMNGLEPERYYEILIKTVVDGNTIIKDDQYYFKVVNG
jgi:hypothetical protein|tara:strand:- start:7962 stop:9113 length:1152 start_codon:yes stop_codon:yes gene_type:complete